MTAELHPALDHDGQRGARRQALLAAADVVVQRHGAAASMAAIASEAGITKPVLYRHFGDKDGLYAALAERYTDRLLAALLVALEQSPTPSDQVRATVDAYFAALESDPQAYRFLVQSSEAEPEHVHRFVRRMQDEVRAQLAFGQAGGAVTAAGVVGLVQGCGEWWLDNRDCPRGEVVDQVCQLLRGALGGARSAGPPSR